MRPKTHKVTGLKADAIESRVSKLLKKHGVSAPPVPVNKIADHEGIIVRYQPFHGESDVSAVLKRDVARTIIGVNSTHSATRQRFSIAHELGHYYLHENESMFVDFVKTLRPRLHYRNSTSGQATDAEEVEANKFAAALLMPISMIRRNLEALLEDNADLPPDTAVSQLAMKFHVSTSAMEFRLLNLGLLVKLDD